MFLLLKFVLIILINTAHAYITQDSEIILLPAWNSTGIKEISLTLKIFGKFIQLNLHKDDQVVPASEVWKKNVKSVTEKLSKLRTDSCFYLYDNHINSAVIKFCQGHGLQGIIFVENGIFEIRPLRNAYTPSSFIDNFCIKEEKKLSFGIPYLVKKYVQYFAGSDPYLSHNIGSKRHFVDTIRPERFTIELAVFVDAEAYRSFMPLLNNDIKNIHNMMLDYVSYIQHFFHIPTLGVLIDISWTRLDIMKEQPPNLPVFNGDVVKLIKSFCEYAQNLNPPNDDDSRHWDIGLYITGTNFRSNKYSLLSKYEISGLSYQDGACLPYRSCAVVPFLPHEIISSGLRSSLNAVHEIGNLLGLEKDEQGEDVMDVYIMSPIRPYRGNITWSPRSRDRIKSLMKEKPCFQDNLRDNTEPENFDGNNNKNDD